MILCRTNNALSVTAAEAGKFRAFLAAAAATIRTSIKSGNGNPFGKLMLMHRVLWGRESLIGFQWFMSQPRTNPDSRILLHSISITLQPALKSPSQKMELTSKYESRMLCEWVKLWHGNFRVILLRKNVDEESFVTVIQIVSVDDFEGNLQTTTKSFFCKLQSLILKTQNRDLSEERISSLHFSPSFNFLLFLRTAFRGAESPSKSQGNIDRLRRNRQQRRAASEGKKSTF